MNTNDVSIAVAQGAEQWQKKRAHEEIMAKISRVRGYYSMEEDYDLYPVKQWNATELSDAEIDEILERRDNAEILALIHQYGELAKTRGKGSVLSEDVQLKLVERAHWDEINEYISYQGFCGKAQKVILMEWPSAQIVHYLTRHGLEPEMQWKLLDRKEELETHIRHHGLADDVITEIFNRLKTNEDYSLFYLFIKNRELPVPGQKQMLENVCSQAFLDYVVRYGLWDEAHVTMLEKRSVQEVKYYLRIHHYLCAEAEDKMVRWPEKEERRDLVQTYIKYWKHSSFAPEDHFPTALMKAPEPDYEIISQILLNMTDTDVVYYEGDKADIALMANGDKEAILARLETGEPLHIRALIELFYRNERQWFETYIAKCTSKICYRYCS